MIIIKAKMRGIKEHITGFRLVFSIPKPVDDDQVLSIQQANGTDGFLTFSHDKLKAEVEAVMKNKKIGISEDGKSKSEILRGTLFQYWQTASPGSVPFEDFYNEKMDGITNKLKQAIEQIDIDRLDQHYNKDVSK
jgi:hypothetical protein